MAKKTAITKQTIVRRKDTEVNSSGSVTFIIAQIVAEGAAVLGSRTHRLTIEPGMDVQQRIDECNSNFAEILVPFPSMLKGLGLVEEDQPVSYPALSDDDQRWMLGVVGEAWTSDVLARAEAARQQTADEIAAARAEQEKAEAKAAEDRAADEEATAQRIAARAVQIQASSDTIISDLKEQVLQQIRDEITADKEKQE